MIADSIISRIPQNARHILGRVPLVHYLRSIFFHIKTLPKLKTHHENIKQRIKMKISFGDIINIVFVVSQNQKWSYQSLFDEFVKDPRYNVKILLVFSVDAICRSFSQEDVHFFEAMDVEVIKGYDETKAEYKDLSSVDMDIAFIEQPWIDMEIIKKASERALIAYVPYGIMAAKIQKKQFDHTLHNISWGIFCESDLHKELYIKYGSRNGENVVVSGHPKLDVYLQPEEDIKCSIWKHDDRKRIIWAPHHSLDSKDLICYSTFDKNYKFFFEYMQKHPEIDWLIKPHPKLFYQIEHTGLMDANECKKYFRDLTSLNNVTFFNEGNYFDIFRTSDALITDSISFLSEYLPTHNPVLFLERPKNTGFNEYGEKIVENYYKAYAPGEIQKFIERVVLVGDDPLQGARERALERYIFSPKEGSGKYIKKYVDVSFNGTVKDSE